MWEHKGQLEGLKVAFVGDGNNVAHSWLNAAPQLGMDVSIVCPQGHAPHPDIVAHAQKFGPQIEVVHDPQAGVAGADVVYADVWASMGQEAEAQNKKQAFLPFQVNDALFESLLGRVREPTAYDRFYPQRRIGEWCAERRISVLDLLEPLRSAEATTTTYRPRNTHWNARGNRVAGEELATFLLPRLLRSTEPLE